MSDQPPSLSHRSASDAVNPASTARRLRTLTYVCILCGLFLSVFGAKLWLIQTSASDLPIHDQWDAEAELTLRPWLEGHLSAAHFFHPHNEHRLVTTKLYALALVALNGQWDNHVATIGSALVHTFCAVLLLVLGCRLLPQAWQPAFALLLLLLFALPFAWANTLVGFQVQFYFLVLFTLGHIWLSLESDRFTARWALGQLSALAALGTLASGFLSSLAVIAALAHRAWRTGKLTRQQLTTLLVAVALTLLGWSLKHDVPGHAPLRAENLVQFARGFLHVLAWPANHLFPWSLALFAPAALFLFRRFRDRTVSFADSILSALLAWFLLQAAATAYARGNGDLLASRYLDLFSLGSLLGFLFIIRELSGRPRRVAAALWSILFVVGLHHQIRGIEESVLQPGTAIHRAREDAIRAYLVSGDVNLLRTENPWDSVYPDPEVLRQRLASPALQQILPPSVRATIPLASSSSRPLPDPLSPPPYPIAVSTWHLDRTDHPFAWRSSTQSADTLPVLRFRIAGHFGPDHPNLQILLKSAADSVPLLSDRSSLDRWKTVNVVRPAGEWWIEVTDADPAAWFAITEPAEVGRLSWLAGKLLKLHLPLFLVGICLLFVSVGLTWFQSLQRPRLDSLSAP